MSSITLNGDTSGSVQILVPAIAGSGQVTIPSGVGTAAVQGVSTNIVSGTAQASTSGTAITFTGIPSWAKRITVMFFNISSSGTSNFLVQIGSGSITSTGYLGNAGVGASAANSTAGFLATAVNVSANTFQGQMVISLVTGFSYVASGILANNTSTTTTELSGGTVTLSGVLDRVRVTTVNGTDTFTAGTINILYE